MKKQQVIFLVTFLACCVLIYFVYSMGSTNGKHSGSNDLNPNQNANPSSSPIQETAAPSASVQPDSTEPPGETENEQLPQNVKQLMGKLTLQQKIGQLLIIGIEDDGTTASQQTKQFIQEQGVGNIILFKRNIKSTEQLSALVQDLKSLPGEQMPPLWVSIDQEGGKVNRLPQQFPSAQALAEQNDPDVTEQTGSDIGKALSGLSIDVDFAPVLDINSNPKNPVIGSRAFGTEPESVVKHSMAMLDGLDDYVLTVGKHFPGHGDTNVDSHYSLPIINKSWEELEQLELIPFRAAIEHHIDAMMVGHLYLPQVDEQYPASLSPTVISHYLRDELNFEGVIITDDLVMGGITENYEVGEAAVLALQAGNTMFIVGHHPEQQQAVIDSLVEAVEQHIIDEAEIDKRVALVLQMKLNSDSYLNSYE